jgi:hypothetical protein
LDNREQRYLRWGMILLVLLNAAGMYKFHRLVIDRHWFSLSTNMRNADLIGWILLFMLVGLVIYIWVAQTDRVLKWIKTAYSGPRWLSRIALVLLVPLLVVYPILIFGWLNRYFLIDWTRQTIFVWLVILTSGVMAVWRRKSWLEMLPFAAAVLAVSYHFATYLPDISNYPFALGWSETTRYYVASTFFDQRIYGVDLPLPFRDFTRYLMQAIPFLVEDSSLWVHRLWQATLRFSSTYYAGYVIAQRYKIKGYGWIVLFSMWAGLYFFEGPVFYNLMVIVILVFWLVNIDRFWSALAAVVGISVWAGLSRINWIPMPGLMAAAFYMLEKPVEGKDFKTVVRYLWQPVVLVIVGAAVGLAVQQGYAIISGNPEEIYYSSFTSYLLWDRLLPNATFSMGILPYTLLLTAPLLTYVAMAFRAWRNRLHFIRPLGLAGILLGLFAGGLLVSVKIGGGTNLHNMDVYLVILLLIAAEVFFGRALESKGIPFELKMPHWLKAVIFAVPILFVISYSGDTFPVRDMAQAQRELAFLQEIVDQSANEGEEVLFISQRHLITFGYIDNVPLVHDHEQLLLQEMAMSQNEEYLENLGMELADQRYALVIQNPLPETIKDEEILPLAAENNVVFEAISPLFTCAYQEATRLLDAGLALYVPADIMSCENIEELN